MGNASYHCRQSKYPVKSWTKKKMVEWLNQKNILYPNKIMSKKNVWTIVKRSRPPHPEYSVDQLAKSVGHEVVCLPADHSELHSIEMAWSQIKGYIKTHNTLFTLYEMEWLTHVGFDVVTPMWWKSLIHSPRTNKD